MKKTSAALLAVPLVASMLLSGCGGSGKADASHSTTATSSPTSTVPPTTSAPTSSTASPTADPNIPAAARAHTPAGAEAFVRYFYEQVNTAWTKPSAGLITALSSSGCKSCAALETIATDLVEKRQHYNGPPVTVVSVAHLGEASPGHPEVLVQFIQEDRKVIDSAGQIATTDQRKQGKFVVALGWSDKGWSVVSVKSLA